MSCMCSFSFSAHELTSMKFACILTRPMYLILRIFYLAFAEALRLHGSRLSDYERQEIDKYQEIWFLGLDACKINAKPGTALNSGYDDDNGSYNKVFFIFNIYTFIAFTSLKLFSSCLKIDEINQMFPLSFSDHPRSHIIPLWNTGSDRQRKLRPSS